MSTVARRRAVARPTHASAAVIGGNDCTGLVLAGLLLRHPSVRRAAMTPERLALRAAGGTTGGMTLEAKAVRRALESGVISARIIDGRVEHTLLLEVSTGAGCGATVPV